MRDLSADPSSMYEFVLERMTERQQQFALAECRRQQGAVVTESAS